MHQLISAAESGAAGLAAFLALCRTAPPAARETLGLTVEPTVLLLDTEGDTDPDSFARLVKI